MQQESGIIACNCGKRYRITPQVVGKQFKCQCGVMVAVPSQPPPTQPGPIPFQPKANTGIQQPPPPSPGVSPGIQATPPAPPQPSSSPGIQSGPGQPPSIGPEASGALPPVTNQPVDLEYKESDYQPSGQVGNLGLLLVFGLLSVLGGTLTGFLCGGVGAGINYIHNLLPVYICIVPLVIIIVLAAVPAVVGFVCGAIMIAGIKPSQCRNGAVAGAIAFPCAVASILLLLLVSSFLFENGFVGFVRLMAGGIANRTWGNEYEPINVPAWLIYGIGGLSALLGFIGAAAGVSEEVKGLPYCETCQTYHTKQNLQKISSNHGQAMMEILERFEFNRMTTIPPCDPLQENRIEIDLWSCECGEEHYLELFNFWMHPAKDEKSQPSKGGPRRVFSIALDNDQARYVKSLHGFVV